jgi:hypothetical protein
MESAVNLGIVGLLGWAGHIRSRLLVRHTEVFLMRKSIIVVALLVLCSWVTAPARADSGGTPEEAKAMAIAAADFLKANGPDKAFAAFTAKQAPWVDRDLYVFVYDETGHAVAHGGNPALVGKNLIDLKDPDGKAFVRELVALKDAGWVEYKWRNPVSNAVESKTSYGIPVGIYRVGVGAYKK